MPTPLHWAGVTWITLYRLVQQVVNLMNEVAQIGRGHSWVIQTMLQRSFRYTTQYIGRHRRHRHNCMWFLVGG